MAITDICPIHGETFFSEVCEHIADAIAEDTAPLPISCLFAEAVGYLCPKCVPRVGPATKLQSLDLPTVCSAHFINWFTAHKPGIDFAAAIQKAREHGKRLASL